MDTSYIINHLGEERENYFNAVSPPIIQSSNFCFKNVAAMKQCLTDEKKYHLYTRGNNPTVEILRKKIAALEGAEDSLIFSSGCAAITASVMANVKAGDHVICVNSPYSWTNNLLNKYLVNYAVTTTMVDGSVTSNFETAIRPNTKVIYLESPNTYLFELQDLEAVAKIAKKHGITTIIDNSYSSPLNQSPIAMGIDIVVNSATKYINGHSDVVGGTLSSSKERIEKIYHSEFLNFGGIISPNDAWLMMRGLRTLPIRMERVAKTTAAVVKFLEKHPKVERMIYPYSASHPQYKLAKKQMKKGCGQFSVLIKAKNNKQVEKFCDSLKRFLIACSWGGYESLVFPVCIINSSSENKTSPPWNLVRFYIGLEEEEVLIEDIKQALEKYNC